VHYLRPLSALPFTFVSLKGTSHYCLLLGHQSSSSDIAYRVSIGVTAFLLGQARTTLMSVSPRIGLHLNQSQPRPAVALTSSVTLSQVKDILATSEMVQALHSQPPPPTLSSMPMPQTPA
jgi:hypothetical protein